MTLTKCSKCNKEYDNDCFYSKTLGKTSTECTKCRSKIYKSKFQKPSSKNTYKFLISKKQKCPFEIDALRNTINEADNYDKFRILSLYGNNCEMKCECSNLATYCTISNDTVTCEYCSGILHEKSDWFNLYCEICLTDEAIVGYYLENKGECDCNGKRQIYEIKLETVEI